MSMEHALQITYRAAMENAICNAQKAVVAVVTQAVQLNVITFADQLVATRLNLALKEFVVREEQQALVTQCVAKFLAAVLAAQRKTLVLMEFVVLMELLILAMETVVNILAEVDAAQMESHALMENVILHWDVVHIQSILALDYYQQVSIMK